MSVVKNHPIRASNMATFGEIVATIKDIVRRPDMDAQVEIRAISALTACHQLAEFIKDRVELEVDVVSAPKFIGTAPYSNDIRVVNEIFGLDTTGEIVANISVHSPGEVAKLRVLGRDNNTAYVVNGFVSFKSNVELTKLLIVGYVKRPEPSIFLETNGTRKLITVTEIANYRTWLLDSHEQAVIDYAVGFIEGLKGNRDLSRLHLDTFERVHTPQLINLASGNAGI